MCAYVFFAASLTVDCYCRRERKMANAFTLNFSHSFCDWCSNAYERVLYIHVYTVSFHLIIFYRTTLGAPGGPRRGAPLDRGPSLLRASQRDRHHATPRSEPDAVCPGLRLQIQAVTTNNTGTSIWSSSPLILVGLFSVRNLVVSCRRFFVLN